MRIQKWMYAKMREVVESYAYEEYDGPMLEPFELYAAKTGEEIVNNQLYWLIDQGERKLAIRPEMTPTLARMVAGQIHELPKPVRWYAIPNLWRYERPQKGRLREHWQLNVDVLGGEPLQADAELLSLALDLIKKFGGEDRAVIRVNNRRLMDHFFSNDLKLSAETALRTTKALDERLKIGEAAYAEKLRVIGVSERQSIALEVFLKSSFAEITRKHPSAGTDELAKLFDLLRDQVAAGKVVFDPMIMRGLDYYTGTVFEMYDTSPENRRAMFGGGRYDNLIGLFGNHKLSGVGFGMGDVTLRGFLETHNLLPKLPGSADVLVTLPRADLHERAEEITRALRAAGMRVMTPLEASGFGVQLKLAGKAGVPYVILLGDDELALGKVAIKEMATGTQSTVPIVELAVWFRDRFPKAGN